MNLSLNDLFEIRGALQTLLNSLDDSSAFVQERKEEIKKVETKIHNEIQKRISDNTYTIEKVIKE